MSTQVQFQASSLETGTKKPLRRTQEFLRELKTSMSLLGEVLAKIKWKEVELFVFRAIVLVHLIKYLWYSIWH